MAHAPIHTRQQVQQLLDQVEWDFSRVRSTEPMHNLHPYPARFIADLPRALIRLFPPREGSTVFDPFCGSGTTLLEAGRAGHDSLGVDLNPVATLISRVKTTRLVGDVAAMAIEIVERGLQEPVEIPSFPRLDHWFKPEIQDAVARLAYQIDALGESAERDALRLSLSRILVRVSNQESDTRYAAIANEIRYDDVFDYFAKSARMVARSLDEEYGGLLPPTGRSEVIQSDILALSPEDVGEVGLLVTSPPYPNAYEYWLYHKYRIYWLGWDPIEVKRSEIGARPHYHGSNPQTEDDFLLQMERSFKLFNELLVFGGKACFVVGRSIIQGREIDNAKLLERAATANGFDLMGSASRKIPTTRKAFNPKHGRIEEESVLVFQKA